MQKLILPLKYCKLIGSYGSKAYEYKHGAAHLGADFTEATGNRKIYASGLGRVLTVTGTDDGILRVYYPGALRYPGGQAQDVVFRYTISGRVLARPGDWVTKDTQLGAYRAKGAGAKAHLHLEAVIPQAGIPPLGTLPANLDGAPVNPLAFLHCKSSAPDFQVYLTAEDAYVAPADRVLGEYD